ncbi:ClpP/crotonase [Myriangium duriaei CBS 260.36]|uniref:ClpP/crotonase n=1 Tax=Myriangium duriaei CBS 260.36 TaxID=1168546 RepID=A0A9P4J5A7_9PEZI|nr:ClpP/crotonase [Myriangium duriaei CBS 260.36]
MTTDDKDPKSVQGTTLTVTSSTAKDRISQISGHIDPKDASTSPTTPRRRRRRAASASDPPADHSDVLSQLSFLRNSAKTPTPTHTGYARQKAAGKLWVHERVAQLFDTRSVREVGSVSGDVTWESQGGTKEKPTSFVPSNNVQGHAQLGGRDVLFTADDFTLRAGHADGAIAAKTVYMEKLAVALRLPMIKLVDGSSGGGSVTTIRTMGWSYVPPLEPFAHVMKQLSLGIPNLGAVLGPAIGLGAARVVSCHFSVMAADVGALFNAGPKVVAGATFEEGLTFRDLGGPTMHCTNGTIDNLAANEEECFAQLRTVLSYLPNCGTQLPPVVTSDDSPDRLDPSLRSIIPRKRERIYAPRHIIASVVDSGSFFEIGALWGTTVVTGLARLAGRPVGIVANDPATGAGALDAQGSQKLARHLKLLDVFNIPLVQLVDVPGYAVGTVAERTATMRWGVELAKTYYATTMPIFSVVVRRVYGVAGGVMLDCRDPRMRVAWPSGEWGSLPLEGGIEASHAAELKGVEKKEGREARDRRYKELDEEYRRLMNPVRTANAFGIEEIIDPARTRPLERAAGRLQPVFP